MLILTCAISIDALSQTATSRAKQFHLENGLAIQGYDPVAYFKQGKAVQGSSEFRVSQQGVTYYFSFNEIKI